MESMTFNFFSASSSDFLSFALKCVVRGAIMLLKQWKFSIRWYRRRKLTQHKHEIWSNQNNILKRCAIWIEWMKHDPHNCSLCHIDCKHYPPESMRVEKKHTLTQQRKNIENRKKRSKTMTKNDQLFWQGNGFIHFSECERDGSALKIVAVQIDKDLEKRRRKRRRVNLCNQQWASCWISHFCVFLCAANVSANLLPYCIYCSLFLKRSGAYCTEYRPFN